LEYIYIKKRQEARDNIKSHNSLFLHYVILLFVLFRMLNVLVINNHNYPHQYIHIQVNQDVIKFYLHLNSLFLCHDYGYVQLHLHNLHTIDHHLKIVFHYLFIDLDKKEKKNSY
jgi:hypothetical protein